MARILSFISLLIPVPVPPIRVWALFFFFFSFLFVAAVAVFAVGLAVRVAQLFPAPEAEGHLHVLWSFLLCYLYVSPGTWMRFGQRICLLCRSWMWDAFRAESVGLECVLCCHVLAWGMVLQPPRGLEQKPNVLTTGSPAMVRTAARNENKASRGNGNGTTFQIS